MAKKKFKEIEKTVKKIKHPLLLLFFVLIFASCGVGGYFFAANVTKNDKFEIVGEKTIELTLGETYEDEGAVAISFGKDISSKIKVESNVDFNEVGQYYLKYSVEDLRYNGVYRYRTIIISEVGNE